MNVPTQITIPESWATAKATILAIMAQHALEINKSLRPTASTGTATASFTATNKPGANNKTSPDTWLQVTVSGTTYYIPAFLA